MIFEVVTVIITVKTCHFGGLLIGHKTYINNGNYPKIAASLMLYCLSINLLMTFLDTERTRHSARLVYGSVVPGGFQPFSLLRDGASSIAFRDACKLIIGLSLIFLTLSLSSQKALRRGLT